MKKILVSALAVFGLLSVLQTPVVAQSASDRAQSLDQLLEQVRQGRAAASAELQRREQEFLRDKARQKQILNEVAAERNAAERQSQQLEAVFNRNESKREELRQQLDERLGSLKDLFDVVQTAAEEAQATFNRSLVSAQFPGRQEKLQALIEKTASGTRLPSIAELETLWFELQREMTESGKIVIFEAEVISEDGRRVEQPVLRVGNFNLSSGQNFIQHANGDTLAAFVRQPAQRYRSAAAAFETTEAGGHAAYPIDPSGGAILSLLVQSPSLWQRIDQGGIISYLIIALGVIGIILVLERVAYFGVIWQRVQEQIKSDQSAKDNPLGRVLAVYDDHRRADVETLELKLDEAIMRELPALERFIPTLKLIAAGAPLLGILGTVAGMIQTFHVMTLFGTGDPKLMAGGISQALVTTVEGLVVAIPMLFAYSLVSSMSRRIIHTLEEQSAGIIAVHAEQEQK